MSNGMHFLFQSNLIKFVTSFVKIRATKRKGILIDTKMKVQINKKLLENLAEFFRIGRSDAFLSLSDRSKVTQNKINFVKSCPSGL